MEAPPTLDKGSNDAAFDTERMRNTLPASSPVYSSEHCKGGPKTSGDVMFKDIVELSQKWLR